MEIRAEDLSKFALCALRHFDTGVSHQLRHHGELHVDVADEISTEH